MEDAAFWELIARARENTNNDYDLISAFLETELLKMPETEILSFARILNQKMAAANTQDLWGAASIINGGCSSDDFEYFRGWLIAQGKAIYEAAVENPDSLADSINPQEDSFEYESILYVAHYVFEVKTGKEVPESIFTDNEIAGNELQPEDLPRKYPKLAQKFNPLKFNN